MLQTPVVVAKNALTTIKTAGERFKIARKSLSLTQPALADRADVRQEAISRFEKGQRGLDPEGFVRLLGAAAALGMSLEFVFTGEGAPKRQSIDVLRAQVDGLASSLKVLAGVEDRELEQSKREAEIQLRPKKKRRRAG